MIPYILHVTVITTACFLFYKLFLQKETFYKLNRWTLLGCLAVSFTLPLLPVPGNWSWRESWTARSAQPVAPPVVERTEPGQKKIAMNEAEPTVSEPRRTDTRLRRKTCLWRDAGGWGWLDG